MVLDEPARILETCPTDGAGRGRMADSTFGSRGIFPQLKISFSYEELLINNRQPRIYLSLFMRQVSGTHPQNIVQFICRSMQQFHGQMHVLRLSGIRWQKADYRVVFTASSKERAERLRRVLHDYGMEVETQRDSLQQGDPRVHIGALLSGFELAGIRLALVTEGEVFTQKQRRPRRTIQVDHGEKIKDYQDLKPGDYVVHVNHGIGRYLGSKP